MDISIFLAKALGLYLLIMGISLFTNARQLKTIMSDVAAQPALLFISGAIALIFGILIVLTHNIWQSNWRILITLIGWLSLFKGIIRIIFPHRAAKYILKFKRNPSMYYVMSLIVFVLGIYLTYVGFV